MRAVEEITAAGGDGMHLIGPCSHTVELPDQFVGLFEFHGASVAWFDRWLKGIPNGIDELGDAIVLVEGPDRYRVEPTWPPSDTDWTQLYVSGPRRAARSGA